jgi:hypothetical protein
MSPVVAGSRSTTPGLSLPPALQHQHGLQGGRRASKRISLNNIGNTLEVGENLKDVVSFCEFKQSLRAARVAQQFCMCWNFSITVLESFLINNDFLSEKVPSGASILSSFCHHVFLLNSLAWWCKKQFLDVVDLGSIWSS